MTERKKQEFWVVVRCCVLIGASLGLISNCIGIFYTPLAEALGTGRGQVAVIATIISLSSAFSGPVVAKLIRRYPMNMVMTAGVVMTVFGLFLFSYVPRLEYFYALAVLIGMGEVCIKALTVSMVLQSWFGSRSASKLGIAMAMSGVVAAVMSPILSRVISAGGYGTGFRLLALLVAVCAIPCTVTMRMDDSAKDRPAVKSAGEKGAAQGPYISPFMMFLLLVLPVLLVTGSGMNTHFSSYAVTLGYSLGFGATLVSFQSIFNSVWKLVSGFISDRIGIIRASLLYIAITFGACIMLMTLIHSQAAIIIAVCLFSAIFSVTTVSLPTIIQYVARERFPEVFAVVNMIQTISYASFTSIFGTMSDRAGSYIPGLIISTAGMILCAAVCIVIGKKEGLK